MLAQNQTHTSRSEVGSHCSVTLPSEMRESHRIKEEITIVYVHLTACLDTHELFFFFSLRGFTEREN